ncbi:MAG: hypothetical protein NVSMB33_13200 [Ktedonobacteraceae bacterium]
MPTDIFFTNVTKKIFIFAQDHDQSIIKDWVAKDLKLGPKQQAFKQALNKAYEQFEKRYPQWAKDLFNSNFTGNAEVPILAQFLIRDGYPDPCELAPIWALLLDSHQFQRLSSFNWKVLSATSDFLDYIVNALRSEPELSDLNDSSKAPYFVQGMDEVQIRRFLQGWLSTGLVFYSGSSCFSRAAAPSTRGKGTTRGREHYESNTIFS